MEPSLVFLLAITCYAMIQPISMLTTLNFCGEKMCICDKGTQLAFCKPALKNTSLSYFPRLPSYITNLTFKNFFRPTITKEDLVNLTHLSLRYLHLELMNIRQIDKGLFQLFPSLQNLSISNNEKLSSVTLRDAFQNISTILMELDLTSNNLRNIEFDMFKYLSHTKLTTLILKGNPLINLRAETVENLNLTKLDLSFSRFDDLKSICPTQSFLPLSNLRDLHLQSTRISRNLNSIFICFPNLTKLHLENNNLNNFPSFCDTQELPILQETRSNLEELYLTNTSIKGNISSNAFRCISELLYLDLNKNQINDVPDFCYPNGQSSVSKLKQLSLEYTSISILMKDSFKCLSSLQILNIKNNVLKNPPNFCSKDNTSYTPNLTSLFLRNTSITSFTGYEFHCLRKLRKLDLRLNYFKYIPSFCDKSNQSINPSLINLDLSWNSIQYIFPTTFRCLSSLKTLVIGHIPISILENNIFRPLTSLKYLEIENLSKLRKIQKHAFNISSLDYLKFTFNNFHFEDLTRYSPEHLFESCKNVKTLILSGNYFSTGSVAQIILKPLKHLTKLALDRNRMHAIHRDTFKSSITLQILRLNYNMLTGWDENVFKYLSNLSDLNLAQNRIAIFNKTSVPMDILNNLETFDLAYNPFNCSCDMIWFRKWSMKTNVTLVLFPHLYRCQSPPNMVRQTLLSFNLTDEDCKVKNPWLIVILTACAGTLFVFCFSLTISMQMPTIKNYIYYLRLRKMGYVKLINDQDFSYDAFVVYCESDENWVIHTLVAKLEIEGFRLCIPDREFDVGAVRCDQIVSAFNESKKILVVLSNNFAKNEWCLWQMNLVEERLRKSGNSATVFVLYKSISSKNMISSLHRVLKERPILTWFKGGTREKMFWNVVCLAVGAPLGEPPISVIQ